MAARSRLAGPRDLPAKMRRLGLGSIRPSTTDRGAVPDRGSVPRNPRVADTAGAFLGNLGAGWPEPGSASLFGQPTAIEPRVLLLEDIPKWPDEKGVEEMALRFGARLDLAFGGPGQRHLDRMGPETGKFNPRW